MITARSDSLALPGTTPEDLFLVLGGTVMITAIFGEVTDTVDDAHTVVVTVTGLGGVTITAAPLGDLVSSPSHGLGPVAVAPTAPVLFANGSAIQWNVNTVSTGSIRWTVLYEQVDPGATVVAA